MYRTCHHPPNRGKNHSYPRARLDKPAQRYICIKYEHNYGYQHIKVKYVPNRGKASSVFVAIEGFVVYIGGIMVCTFNVMLLVQGYGRT